MFVNRKSPKVYFETASILSNVCGNGFEAGGCYMESGETTQCAYSNIERTQSERKVRCDFSFETIVCKEDCGTQRFLDFTFSKKWGIWVREWEVRRNLKMAAKWGKRATQMQRRRGAWLVGGRGDETGNATYWCQIPGAVKVLKRNWGTPLSYIFWVDNGGPTLARSKKFHA